MFICDIYKVYKVWDVFDVGGVVIGDVFSWWVDNMFYGGVKDLGLGCEGICYVIEDMFEIWFMVICIF